VRHRQRRWSEGDVDDGEQATNDDEGDSSSELNKHEQCHDVGAAGRHGAPATSCQRILELGVGTCSPGQVDPTGE
jgi:hypothetical protein